MQAAVSHIHIPPHTHAHIHARAHASVHAPGSQLQHTREVAHFEAKYRMEVQSWANAVHRQRGL